MLLRGDLSSSVPYLQGVIASEAWQSPKMDEFDWGVIAKETRQSPRMDELDWGVIASET
jgi:hypothetical protein